MIVLRIAITVLCTIGLYPTLIMLRKIRMAERGELTEPSIVQEPRARLFFGMPNTVFGSLYYPLLAAGVWIYPFLELRGLLGVARALGWFMILAAAAAAATSCFLAYSLIFITKSKCPFCWTAHTVNWLLLLAVLPLSCS